MKNKISFASEMQKNLQPQQIKNATISAWQNLSQAADLAEKMELFSLAEALTNLFPKEPHV